MSGYFASTKVVTGANYARICAVETRFSASNTFLQSTKLGQTSVYQRGATGFKGRRRVDFRQQAKNGFFVLQKTLCFQALTSVSKATPGKLSKLRFRQLSATAVRP